MSTEQRAVRRSWAGVALCTLSIFTLLCASLGAQDPAPPKVDQAKVDAAVEKGSAFLRERVKEGLKPVEHAYHGTVGIEELVLYTLVHVPVRPEEDEHAKLLQALLQKKMKWTYEVSLHAMALQAIDPQKHQIRIAQCGQFLVDTQAKNGQWGYYTAMEIPGVRDVETDGGRKEDPKGSGTRGLRRIPIRRRTPGPDSGDNSNSQYAALGIRACLEAGVEIPRETMGTALGWWEKAQEKDGGWSYDINGNRAGGAWGTMTAGGVGASIIYRHYLKLDYKKDPKILGGIRWLDENFTVTENPKYAVPSIWQFYWLYAVERAGMLYGTENLGKHEWYVEGADWLLANQKTDGSWHNPGGRSGKVENWPGAIGDTCFAILFLRRATRPLPAVKTR